MRVARIGRAIDLNRLSDRVNEREQVNHSVGPRNSKLNLNAKDCFGEPPKPTREPLVLPEKYGAPNCRALPFGIYRKMFVF
jgi:hypothetical protein